MIPRECDLLSSHAGIREERDERPITGFEADIGPICLDRLVAPLIDPPEESIEGLGGPELLAAIAIVSWQFFACAL